MTANSSVLRHRRLSNGVSWTVAFVLPGLMLALGAALPWTSMSSGSVTIVHVGADLGPGVLTAFVGLGVTLFAVLSSALRVRPRLLPWTMIGGGMLSILLVAETALVDGLPSDGRFDLVVGLAVTFIGAMSLVAAGAHGLAMTRAALRR